MCRSVAAEPGRVVEHLPGWARLRVPSSSGREVAQRRAHDRRRRKVLLRALPLSRGQALLAGMIPCSLATTRGRSYAGRGVGTARTRIRRRQLAVVIVVACAITPVFNVLTSEASLRSAIQGLLDAALIALLVGGYLLFVRDGRLRHWFRRPPRRACTAGRGPRCTSVAAASRRRGRGRSRRSRPTRTRTGGARGGRGAGATVAARGRPRSSA